jgi:hypothetical protein
MNAEKVLISAMQGADAGIQRNVIPDQDQAISSTVAPIPRSVMASHMGLSLS